MSNTRSRFIELIKRKPELATLEDWPCADCNKPASIVHTIDDTFVLMHEDCEEDESHPFNPAPLHWNKEVWR